jgi:response regulator RpfG family c-di-GMP phosphodiesterase
MKEKILLVDDDKEILAAYTRLLRKKYILETALGGEEGLEAIADKGPYAIVVSDMTMPKMDGVQFLAEVSKVSPDSIRIMLTGNNDLHTAIDAINKGQIFRFLIKPCASEIFTGALDAGLEMFLLKQEVRDYQEKLEEKVTERTEQVNQLNKKLKESFLNYMKVSLSLVENFDPFLPDHSKRVAILVLDIGKQMDLSERELLDLQFAGLLHELGKVAIPENIRNKPFAELSDDEIHLIRQTPVFSQEIISNSKELDNGGKIIRHHMEYFDGTGFPDRLRGEDIPLASRILGVANAFDELISRRRFTREKLPTANIKLDFALAKLKNKEGIQYDQNVIEKLELVANKYVSSRKTRSLANVGELNSGMTIAMDIHNNVGELVIPEGNTLSRVQIIKLKYLYEKKMVKSKIKIFEQ